MRRSSFKKLNNEAESIDVSLSRDVSSQYDNVKIVADDMGSVVIVAESMTALQATYDSLVDITAVANQIVPNLAEILEADTNAATATAMAVTATTQAGLATTARAAAEVAQGVAETKASDAGLSAIAADVSADLATASEGAATAQAVIAATQAGVSTAQAVVATTRATEAEAARDDILGMGVATGVAGTAAVWDGTTLTIPRGDQGIQGTQGLKGDIGEGLKIKGVDTAANILLIIDAAEADFWIASDTGDGYGWTGIEWKNSGQIRGPQGVQGIQGVVGPQGDQGIQGIQGIQGVQGIQGEIGTTGSQGLKGDTGAALTIRGTDTVANILLKAAVLGDFWVASDTGDGYAGSGSSWINTGQIRGPQGLQGIQGEVGPKGDTGDTGIQGIQGIQGVKGDTGDVTAQQLADGLATKASTVHNHDSSYYTEGEIDTMLAGLDPLPTQTGQAGKYLTTSGVAASWADVASGSEHYDQEGAPASPSLGATWYKPSTGKIYTRVSDGTTETWLDSGASSTGVTQVYVEDAVGIIDAAKADVVHAHIKADVGLGSVDNTSDANKPVSTAGQTALDLKANISNPTIVGLKEVSVAMGANDINLATGNHFRKTISGTVTLTVSNVAPTGTLCYMALELLNAKSGTLNWFAGIDWAGGVAPDDLTVSGKDVITLYTWDGGTTWNVLNIQRDLK